MAKSGKASVVDGYSVVQAARHAAKTHDRAATPASPSPTTSDATPADIQKLGAHVAHTAIPAKRIIECYECGYKFQLHGRAATTTCNKCRKVLDLTDHVIDGKWSKSFKTAGTVRLTEKGVLQSGEIVANDFILEGTIEAGKIRAMRRLELHPGARFSEQNIKAPDLLIAAGATIAFTEPAEYRDVEIAGALRANLLATGAVTIRANGGFDGRLQTQHLAVEEGGGLCAEMQVEPATASRGLSH